jgi:hypothetical protein
MCNSFFPERHPISAKDMPPFNKSQIVTLALQPSTLCGVFGLEGLL